MIIPRVGASRAARRPVRLAAGCAAAAALIIHVLFAAASAQHHSGSPGLPRGIPAFCSDATIVSAGTGAWSDPNTWSPTGVPQTGARVRIAAGHEVTYDLVSTDAISCILVEGALKFRTDTSTMLTVGTMLVMDSGELEIGTGITPVEAHVRAELVFANQPIDLTTDPEQFGTGLLAFGKVRMHGAVKSPTFVRLAFDRKRGTGDPRQGDAQLNLEDSPIGWQAGDRLILPDTRQLGPDERFQNASFDQAERLTAAMVNFSIVDLAAPLQFNHEGARNATGTLEFTPHVGNLTRNVVISSADPQGVRGHTLYTQQADVDLRYVQFQDMGRTLNEQQIDSTSFDEAGNVTHIGENQIGRNPIHLYHLRGPANARNRGYQFTLVGNAFVDSRKGPITVRQSHYGLISDNVIFNATGAGIMTEDGNESYNEFVRNFVVGIVGRGNANDGTDGAAFWFKGFNHLVQDNVAANVINKGQFIVNGAGFSFAWPPPLHGSEVKIPTVRGADLSNPIQHVLMNMLEVPILGFANNEAYGAVSTGLTFRYLGTDGRNTDIPAQESFISNFTAWHVHEQAFFGYPTHNVTFDRFIVRGHPRGLGPQSTAAGFAFGDYKNRNVTIRGADIQRMNTGIDLSQATEGTFLIENSRLQNYYSNISARTLETPGTLVNAPPDRRTTIIRNVNFVPMPPPPNLDEKPFVAVSMQWNDTPNNPNFYWDQSPDKLFIYDYTVGAQPTGENYQLFYPPQETRSIAGGLATCSDRPKDDFQGIVYVDGLPTSVGRTIACSFAGGDNASPVAVDDSVTTDAGVAVVVNVLANDSDPDGDPLRLTNVSDPPDGSAQINGSAVTYTPDAGFEGLDSFTYTIDDGRGGSVQGGVTVTVRAAGPVNNPPAAVDDTVATGEDIAVILALLANDTDADGDSLSVQTLGPAQHGVTGFSAEGNQPFYSPNPNYCGPDSFEYTVGDGRGGTDVGTVTVDVSCRPDPPQPQADTFSIPEDSVGAVLDVLFNDINPDANEVLSVVACRPGQGADPGQGAVEIAPNGTHIIYTPPSNFFGTASFVCKVWDGAGPSGDAPEAAVTVNVTPVNDPPTAVDDVITVGEDSGDNVVSVLPNDTASPDHGETLSVVDITQATGGLVHIGGEGRQLFYRPNSNFCGQDSFTYTVSDGHGGTDTGTVNITVTCVNDAPQPRDDVFTMPEDSENVVLDVLANDINVDQNETLRVGSCGIVMGVDNPHGTFRVAPDRTHVIYTPDPDYSGPASFVCSVEDGFYTGANAPSARATINITPVNDAPAAVDDPAITNEDTAITIGVLANDTDVDGDTLVITAVSNPSHGTAQLAGSTISYTPALNFSGSDQFTYTIRDAQGVPATATVRVTVNPVNDAPVAVDDPVTIDEDSGPVAIPVVANDADVDGDTLVVTAVSSPSNGTVQFAGGAISYTPAANFNGSDRFTYTISDGHGGVATAGVNVTVRPVNDPPTAVDDVIAIDEDSGPRFVPVLANDTFAPDLGESLSVVSFGTPAHGTVGTGGESGQLIYTPNRDFCGGDSFEYTITDGSLPDVGTVIVNVACVNDLPRPQPDFFAVAEDSVGNVLDVLQNDVDPEGNPFFVLGCFAETMGTLHGTVTLAANGTHVIYTPDPNFFGTASFVCKVTEGAGPGIDQPGALVTVTVTPVNDVPLAANDSYTLDRSTDTVLSVSAPGILANDGDGDNPTLTAVQVTGPANGSLTLNADGSFTYTPNADFLGSDSFTYRAFDGIASSAVATVSITINAESVSADVGAGGTAGTDDEADGATPADPVETSVTLPEDVAGSVLITEGAMTQIEPEDFTFLGQQVNITAPAATAGAPLVLVFRLDASIIPAGHNQATLQVFRNGAGVANCAAEAGISASPDPCIAARELLADGDVQLTVRTSAASHWNFGTPDNTAPVAVDDTFETDESTMLTGNVLANDVDSDTLTAALVGAPLAGLTFNAEGSFTYTPEPGVTGPVTFSYRASDGHLESNIATVTITVRPGGNSRPWIGDLADDWWYEGDAIWMGVEAGDPDGDELTFTAQGLPPGIQIDPHRGTLYGPFERITSVGRHEITITVSDGRLSASETVTWEIREKNEAPWLPRPRDQRNFEHDTVFFQLAGADPDWDPITFTATGLPPGVTIDRDGTVHGHLALRSAGTYLVTAKISDGRQSASTTFKWTVSVQQ